MGDTNTATADISGSPSVKRVKAAASTNATLVKGARGNVYGFQLNSNAAAAKGAFIKFYDKATAPTVGTDVPVFTIPVVSTTSEAAYVGYNVDEGIPFQNGIAFAITAGVADTDVAAVAADDIHGFILFK